MFGTNCDQKMGKLCRNRKSSGLPNPRPTAPHCSRSPRAKTPRELRPTPRAGMGSARDYLGLNTIGRLRK